jgi:hypothetical protein
VLQATGSDGLAAVTVAPTSTADGSTQLYRGSVQPCENVAQPGSIVILGNVEKGATVVAGGDVIVWGEYVLVPPIRGLAPTRRKMAPADPLLPYSRLLAHLSNVPQDRQSSLQALFSMIADLETSCSHAQGNRGAFWQF